MDIERELPAFCQKFSAWVAKSVFYVSRGTFWCETFVEKKCAFVEIFFEPWLEKINLLDNFFPQGCQNCIFRVPSNILEKKYIFFWKRNFLYPCGPSSGNISVLCQKSINRAVKTPFYFSKEEFLEETLFFFSKNKSIFFIIFGNELKIFSRLLKQFGWRCHNCILHVRRTISGEISSKCQNLFCHCRILGAKFLTMWQSFLGRTIKIEF